MTAGIILIALTFFAPILYRLAWVLIAAPFRLVRRRVLARRNEAALVAFLGPAAYYAFKSKAIAGIDEELAKASPVERTAVKTRLLLGLEP